MRYIKTFENHKSSDITIKKGRELFHSTGEDFDISKLSGGGYDNILWTTFDSGISQTYIPVSGTVVLTNTDLFISPPRIGWENIPEYTNLVGLTFKDIRYSNGNRTSYVPPKEFDGWSEKQEEISKQLSEKEAEYKELEKQEVEFSNKDSDYIVKNRKEFIKILDKQIELGKEIEELEKKYHENDPLKYRRKYVNDILSKMGYKPSIKNNDGNHSYQLKTTYKDGEEVLLPADYRSKGRLIILTPKVDLNIYDARKSKEGDLTELEYHNISLFEEIEKNPKYDGVYINDFAQIESEGNFGHTSVGLFNRTIRKMNIDVIENVEHPTETEIERMVKDRNWQSKEYLNR